MSGKYAIETAFNFIDNITRPMSKIDTQAKIVNRSLKNMYVGAERATARVGNALKGLGKGLLSITGFQAMLNPGAFIGFVTRDIKNAIEFQSAIAKVGTVADAAAVPLDKLSKGILAVSTRVGVESNKIAESVYAAITAGIPTAKAVSFVETATKAAIGGFTDEAVAIDGLTSVLNAYGLQAEAAESIANKMLLTQNLGKTSFADMAQSIDKVVPYAAQLGVTTDELFASITSLTGSGSLKTAEAMTSMRAVLTSVINPTSEAAETARRLGVDFSASALQGKGLVKFLNEISTAAGGNQNILGKLFGSDKADLAVRVLTSSGSKAFSDAIDAMQNSSGAMDAAFEKVMDTPEKRWAKVMNTFRNAGISLGNSLLPIVEKIIEKIGGIAESFAKIDFSKYTGSFEAAFNAIDFFISALIGAIKIAWQFRGVISAVLGVMAAYYGISMLVVGVTKAFTIWEGIKKVAIFGSTLATQGYTAALATLTAGSKAHLVIEKIFALASAARTAILGVLTGGTLAQTAATASMAVATGTATAAQWLLNAAMTANPIGVIIMAVAALIGLIIVLVKNFDYVVAGIKTIGDAILTLLLTPIWLVTKALSFLPGEFGNSMKEANQKIGDQMGGFFDRTSDRFQKVADNRAAKKLEKEKKATDEVLPPEMAGLPEGVDIPVNFEMGGAANPPDFSGGAKAIASGGKSKLHGVVDVLGGAIPSIPGADTTLTATSGAGAAANSGIPETLTRTGFEIAAILRKIDVSVASIAQSVFPRITTNGDGGDTPEYISPRNIAPITQAERTAYNYSERMERLIIEVAAEKGTSARIVRAPRDAEIALVHSGGNA